MAYTTIDKSSLHFNTKIYTGTDNSNAITGVGFEPSWTWIKSSTTASSALQDAVRGNTKTVRTNSTSGEYTNNFFTSFDSDGFTVATSESDVNSDATSYASFNWKSAGAGSSNSDGSITSTVSANTTSGFSIVKYNGNSSTSSTIGHGLGAVPSVIFLKNVGQTEGWVVYHKELGATHYLELSSNAGDNSGGETVWYDTLPTSSLFTIGNSGKVNGGSSHAHVAYCFSDKQGYSKSGSYFGNGSGTDGKFTYTGFKPAWVIIKRSDASANWRLFNNKVSGYNSDNKSLYPNLNNGFYADDEIEFYSNGFKQFNTDGELNTNGNKFVYLAFAEAPLVGSNNVPCTAR